MPASLLTENCSAVGRVFGVVSWRCVRGGDVNRTLSFGNLMKPSWPGEVMTQLERVFSTRS
jgi:hypothetical protein